MHRLPMIAHSGYRHIHTCLPLRGQHRFRTCFPFNRAVTPGTLKRRDCSRIAARPPSSQTTFKNPRYHLTCLIFLNYSLPVKAEFDTLEQKLAQLVKLSQRLRAENHELRQALAESQSSQRQCNDKIDQAKARLEKLLEQLPEDE